MRWPLLFFFLFIVTHSNAQTKFDAYFSALKKQTIDSGITLTFDEPRNLDVSKPTKVIIFALPNGNTTAQTFGKKLAEAEDWHFDIQHIGAQTAFIRNADPKTNYIVVYFENNLKSWPAWRRKYVTSDEQIGRLVNQMLTSYQLYRPKLILTCHSGGGSFIFGYINSQVQIPSTVERIGFLDATYGYESERHGGKLKTWLKLKNTSLQIIAYNDGVVLFNGKPLVSPTGGTWYRSKLMAEDLRNDFKLNAYDFLDRLAWSNKKQLISFSLIKNTESKIFHTVLVEKNGFIHLVLNGTPFQSKNYQFWGDRAYQSLVLN